MSNYITTRKPFQQSQTLKVSLRTAWRAKCIKYKSNLIKLNDNHAINFKSKGPESLLSKFS